MLFRYCVAPGSRLPSPPVSWLRRRLRTGTLWVRLTVTDPVVVAVIVILTMVDWRTIVRATKTPVLAPLVGERCGVLDRVPRRCPMCLMCLFCLLVEICLQHEPGELSTHVQVWTALMDGDGGQGPECRVHAIVGCLGSSGKMRQISATSSFDYGNPPPCVFVKRVCFG